jgi:hypothetical protein
MCDATVGEATDCWADQGAGRGATTCEAVYGANCGAEYVATHPATAAATTAARWNLRIEPSALLYLEP